MKKLLIIALTAFASWLFGVLPLDADTSYSPQWAAIRTTSIPLILNNAGNMGKTGQEPGNNMNFFNDCDITDNTYPGLSDNSKFYLFDASPFILHINGNDTILNSYIYQADWLNYDGFKPLGNLTIDLSHSDYQFAGSGKFMTPDSLISLECNYWAPHSAESTDFIVQEMKVYNNCDSTLHNIYVGQLMDWDIPSDSFVDNGSGLDGPRKMLYCYGAEYGADPIPNNDCVLADQRCGGIAFFDGYRLPFTDPATDSLPWFQYLFSDYASPYIIPPGIFAPGKLYQRLYGKHGIEIFNTDSLRDIFIGYNLGVFDIPAGGGVVGINILASEYDGGAAGLKQTVDKAQQWIANRPGLIARPQYFYKRPLWITAYSPVNLRVVDPLGNFIQKDADGILTQTIFPADYNENPPNDLDSVIIYFPVEGDYTIEVIPETDAPVNAKYSIGIRIDGSDEAVMIMNATVPAPGMTDTLEYMAEEGWHFINGDANRSGVINALDVTFLINFLYKHGPEPNPIIAGDANCSGLINALDVTRLINFLYKHGPAPCQP